MSMKNFYWEKIYNDFDLQFHDFKLSPYYISLKEMKHACLNTTNAKNKKLRITSLYSREDRPDIFKEHNLFLLPTKNGHYCIIQGEGYVDLPKIEDETLLYTSKLDFKLTTSEVGDSEMQHLDFAYASSLIRTFTDDPSLVLTIRGRKYTPEFDFIVGQHHVKTSSVQTEVDAGYEGKDQVVLVEAKNNNTTNFIIRQLYYPFRQWQIKSGKKVTTLFFEKSKKENVFSLWQFCFNDPEIYNSIELVKSKKYKIIEAE